MISGIQKHLQVDLARATGTTVRARRGLTRDPYAAPARGTAATVGESLPGDLPWRRASALQAGGRHGRCPPQVTRPLPARAASRRAPRSARWLRACSGLVLAPACAAGFAAQPALAHDDLWSQARMGEPASDVNELRRPEHPGRGAPASPAAPGVTTAPARPLHGLPARRGKAGASPAAWSVAGWDLYASVRLDGVRDSGVKPAFSLRVTPAILVTRDVGALRLAAHAAVGAPLYGSRAEPGVRYRFGGAVRYQPANDTRIDAGLEIARVGQAALQQDANDWNAALPDGRQLACGSARINVAGCERRAGGMRVMKQAGDFTFTASAGAVSSRWSSAPSRQWPPSSRPRQTGDDVAIAGQFRASRRFSHQFEPYVDIGATRWRSAQGDAGRQRVAAGALFPEISLFSGQIYAGVDMPAHGATLPVFGGALSWSPRRALVLAARAETGVADGLPPDAGNVLPFPGGAQGSEWRAGRRTWLSLSALWKLAPNLDLTLASAWENARWRPTQPVMARREDQTASAAATLAWTFAPQWLARLEIMAIRQAVPLGPPQKRIVTALSLQRML